MATIERHYEVAFVEDTDVSGIWQALDGMHHYSIRGYEVNRAEYKTWLDAQDDETRALMEPHFHSICN